MKGHLTYAAAEYAQDSDSRGVRPISSVDGQIITELIELLQVKGQGDIAKVLDRWKAIDDQEILDHIVDLSKGELSALDSEILEFKDTKVAFIQIKNHIFEAHQLFSIETKSSYKNGRSLYCLIINGVDENMTSIRGVKKTNVIVEYYSEKQLNNEVESIKKKLTEYSNCVFL
jgi:formate dehydrogenase maturation protein FdhE